MTRRGFIKRIGGVAAGALAVATVPASIGETTNTWVINETSFDFKFIPIPRGVIENTLGLTRNSITDAQFRKDVKAIIEGYGPLKLDAPLSWK